MNAFKLLFTLRTSLMGAYRLIGDARVPMKLKLIALGAALFILSRLNILGDIPFLGIVDDAALLGFLAQWFVRAASPYASERTAPPRGTDLVTP